MTITDYVISLIRTWVPIAVGSVAAWLVAHGIGLDPGTAVGATAALSGVLSGVYYALVRLVEAKFPALGVLLGHTAKPSYVKATEVIAPKRSY